MKISVNHWLILAALTGPSFLPASGSAQEFRAAKAALTMEQARARAERVSDVSYEFAVRLDADSPDYTGEVLIGFDLSDAGRDLTLDFAEGTVISTSVNGTSVDAAYNGAYLTLPAATLAVGANLVQVSFSAPYSRDGNGLYRFVDPEDGRVYLYTDFEPYHQNRVFPSFDQPDLKARFATEVTAPADWVVISVTDESEAVEQGDEKVWTFPPSAPISTYIYALHAGQYHAWESLEDDIPMRLFARESLAGYVDAGEWFEFTRLGFEFFQDYFGVPYPFGKYDQVIVPHFNAGAMENVGAVTFSERFVRRGNATRQERRSLAGVILHEMAHMWFGNLVTMDWWNGLWLNESFATFMATLGLAEATEFSEAWQIAYNGSVRAYRADERDTTHPIESPVPDTDAAFANFDAITYQKGSAALQQLNYLVGPDSFQRGVSNYLERLAYGNSSIDDFLEAIATASGRDLDEWSRNWLLQPGTNSIAVDTQCIDDELTSLQIAQTAPTDWPTLRTHRTQLGLYYFTADDVVIRTLPVTYAGEVTEVPVISGVACPDLIYPNHGDWDFVRARLDPRSLPELGHQLNRFEDPLVRSMLWQGIWEMVLHSELKITDYADFVLSNLGGEPDDAVFRQVLGTLQSSVSYLVRLDPGLVRFGETVANIELFLWRQMGAAEAGSDRQLLMFDRYTDIARSEVARDGLAQALEYSGALPDGIELDQDRRWSVVHLLNKDGHPRSQALLDAERARDASDRGRLAALAAEAARPDAAVKDEWVRQLLDSPGSVGLADLRTAAFALFPDDQLDLYMPFVQSIFSGLEAASETVDPSYYSSLLGGLVRPVCTTAYLEELTGAIDASDEWHPTLRRGLLNTRFAVQRCLAVGERLEPAAMDEIAEEYVHLVLAMGEHDADYVDAYFGPPVWAETAPQRFPTPDVIRDAAQGLLGRLRALERPEDGVAARRVTALESLLISLTVRIDVISGVELSFDEETRLIYGVVAPDYDATHYEAILEQIEAILPGEGDLTARAVAFRDEFVIPPDRLDVVFDAAIAECRRRTIEHIELPPGEDFTLEYVTDKPWSGYNWYRGNAFSLIQINTDLPRHIDRAIDLGCHEGYPGHHTYGSLTERELYRGRGWVEFSVYPLFSPTALLSEGSANFGIELAFPGAERDAYEVDTLYPLAGLDPELAERYNRYLQLRAQLGYARIDAARDYLDGRMSRAQAVDWLQRFQLVSAEEAEQSLDFIDTYGTYVINYSLGQDLVGAYIEAEAGDDRMRRWQLFEQLLSEPFSVTELGGG